MLPLSLSPPPRVNHFVNSNDMVTKIKASTILHAEASLTSMNPLKLQRLRRSRASIAKSV